MTEATQMHFPPSDNKTAFNFVETTGKERPHMRKLYRKVITLLILLGYITSVINIALVTYHSVYLTELRYYFYYYYYYVIDLFLTAASRAVIKVT